MLRFLAAQLDHRQQEVRQLALKGLVQGHHEGWTAEVEARPSRQGRGVWRARGVFAYVGSNVLHYFVFFGIHDLKVRVLMVRGGASRNERLRRW